jgi:hypothetical protein
VSDKLSLTEKPLVYVFPLAATVMIILLKFSLSAIISASITSQMIIKILISIAIVFPIGIVLGIYFPAGMKLVKNRIALETPWFWALNGIFGVMSSAVAVFISIYAGFSVNFYIAAICYALLTLTLKSLYEEKLD